MELKVSYGKDVIAIVYTAGKIYIGVIAISATAGLVSYVAPILFTGLKPLVTNAIAAEF